MFRLANSLVLLAFSFVSFHSAAFSTLPADKIDFSGSLANSKFSGSDGGNTGFQGAINYQWGPQLSFSGGWTLYQNDSDRDGDSRTWSLFSSANLSIPSASPVTPYVQFGLQRWQHNFDSKLDESDRIEFSNGEFIIVDESFSDSGIDTFFGLGADYKLNRDIDLFFNYRRSGFEIDGFASTLETYMVGFKYYPRQNKRVITHNPAPSLSIPSRYNEYNAERARIQQSAPTPQPEPTTRVSKQNPWGQPSTKESTPTTQQKAKPMGRYKPNPKDETVRANKDNGQQGAINNTTACSPEFKELFSSCR